MGKFKNCRKKWKDGKVTGKNTEAIGKPSGENTLWRKPKDFKRRNVLVEDKNYYSREWKEEDRWSFSKSIKKEPPPWSSIDTRQVKPWEVVERNKEENQTTTLATHEVPNSRGISFEGIRDGEGSCKDKE
jgi:hypothetical protein